MSELNQVIEDLGRSFEEFKQTNEQRMKAVEAGKGVAELEAKLAKISEALSSLEKLKTRLEDLETKYNRPGRGATGGDQEYKAGFDRFVRKGDSSQIETKSVNTTTDATGGYAVPEELDRQVLSLMRNDSPMRELCNSITLSSSDYKKLVNLGGAAGGWVGETAARPETGAPSLAQITAYMGELYANPSATQTSLDDLFFDVEKWLSEELAMTFAEMEGDAFVNGNGINKPKGILAYALSTVGDDARPFGTIQNVMSGAVDAIEPDSIIDLVYSLKKKYRSGAVFQASSMTYAALRKLKDAQGNYLWQPGLQAGQPAQLAGYAAHENEDLPLPAAAANAVLFGDFKRSYTIVDRIGTRVVRDPYTNKPFVHFYTTKRVGGMLVDGNAVKVLTIGV